MHTPTEPSSAEVSLLVQTSGRCELRFENAWVELRPGQLVFADVGKPLELQAFDPFAQNFVLLPKRMLGAVPHVLFGRTTDPENPVDQLLFQHVVGLARAARDLNDSHMPNALGALLSLVLLSTPMSDSGPRRSSRYERALTYIRVRVGDPELTPDRVAANQGISRRHLDALFAKAGSTIARTILSCRLEHAAMLLSQSPSSCPVLTIAIDSGFKSASHFSRAFRLRYGIAPTAFRRRTRAH